MAAANTNKPFRIVYYDKKLVNLCQHVALGSHNKQRDGCSRKAFVLQTVRSFNGL